MNDFINTHQEAGPSEQPIKKSTPFADDAFPRSILPPELEFELARVRTIDLVDKVYCSPDQETVVVELWRNKSLGLKFRNILFFPIEGFVVSQVYEAIARLKKTSPDTVPLESLPKQPERRIRLLL